MRHVLLCDSNGNVLEISDIKSAHEGDGKLHRAFSVFVFRNNWTELLIQKRVRSKLFGGLWANTCCSHFQKEEDLTAQAEERLNEECGFACSLTECSSFIYNAKDPEGKGSENEYDTVFVGEVDGDIDLQLDPEEVEDAKWVNLDDLVGDLDSNPDKYSPWFPVALEKILSKN